MFAVGDYVNFGHEVLRVVGVFDGKLNLESTDQQMAWLSVNEESVEPAYKVEDIVVCTDNVEARVKSIVGEIFVVIGILKGKYVVVGKNNTMYRLEASTIRRVSDGLI